MSPSATSQYFLVMPLFSGSRTQLPRQLYTSHQSFELLTSVPSLFVFLLCLPVKWREGLLSTLLLNISLRPAFSFNLHCHGFQNLPHLTLRKHQICSQCPARFQVRYIRIAFIQNFSTLPDRPPLPIFTVKAPPGTSDAYLVTLFKDAHHTRGLRRCVTYFHSFFTQHLPD
jgi:hypothetical protein